jgi:regulator of sigma E protease
MYWIAAVLVFGVLVIVHELGHFMLAKLNGVCVEEFSVGMGPKLFSIQRKETLYSLRLFPIGGYVKMLGEEDEEQNERSFSAKSPLRRITIVLAGIVMNILFAIFAFTIYVHANGYTDMHVAEVAENSAGIEAGFETGDKILKVNGHNVYVFSDIGSEIDATAENEINFTIDRNGANRILTIIPSEKSAGLSFSRVQAPTYLQSIKEGSNGVVSLTIQNIDGLKKLFTGKANVKTDVGGPVTIVKTSEKFAELGIWPLIYFTGFLSISLAIMNAIPFPALDGGHFVLLLIELITRRKISDKVKLIYNGIGFVALIILMVLITIKDIIFPVQF